MLQYRVCSQEIQRNAEETHASKNDVLSQNKDLEKKIKILEADLVQCQANISAAERARQFAENERKELRNAVSEAERERRIAENERDELAKKLSNASLALEEKKRLDVRWGQELSFIFFLNNTLILHDLFPLLTENEQKLQLF